MKFSAIGYWLLAIGYWLLAVGYWQLMRLGYWESVILYLYEGYGEDK